MIMEVIEIVSATITKMDLLIFARQTLELTVDCSYVTIVTSREQAFFVSIFDYF